MKITTTPTPPYYAVIFSSVRTEGNNGYSEAAAQMLELAEKQPGFLGFETSRQEIGISDVQYFKYLSEERGISIRL